MQHRRLARDYEAQPDHSASMITLTMIYNLAKKTHPHLPKPPKR